MVLSRQVLVVCSVIVLWAATMNVGHAFNFPGTTDAQMPPPPPSAAASTVSDASDPMVDLSRQGITPLIVTPGTNSCICVAPGQCTFGTTVPGGNTDGSGLIDIRIVNSQNTVSTVSTTIASTTPATANPLLAVATQTSCSNGLILCCYSGPYHCGVRFPPIPGAPSAGPGQAQYNAYPWQAVLLGPGDVYSGSGALIDNQHVLTAAHRVTQYLSGTQLRVRLGEWDAANTNEPIQPLQQVVARIFVHPNFNSANLKNDVAILRLTTPVALGQYPTIGTACLPTAPMTNQRCFVSGWGKNDFSNSGSYQAIQKEVDVPLIASTQCEAQLRSTRLGPTFLLDLASFICAGGEAGKDACTGDGGSPLVCQSNNRWYVAGLVAWGIGCGQSNVPGVYVNVANYISWIQSTVRA